jgi:hypothetical protein
MAMPYLLVGLTVLSIVSALASHQWPWGLTAAVVLLALVMLLTLLGVKA